LKSVAFKSAEGTTIGGGGGGHQIKEASPNEVSSLGIQVLEFGTDEKWIEAGGGNPQLGGFRTDSILTREGEVKKRKNNMSNGKRKPNPKNFQKQEEKKRVSFTRSRVFFFFARQTTLVRDLSVREEESRSVRNVKAKG